MSIPPNGILKPEWELTDEEIQQACRSGFVWFPVVSTADRNIAQVAQKKLVEWGNGECPHGKTFVRRHNCFKCWQALCEGVK